MSAVETLGKGSTVVRDQDCACPNPQQAAVTVEAVSSVVGTDLPTVVRENDCACPTPALAEASVVAMTPVASGATIEVTVAVPAA